MRTKPYLGLLLGALLIQSCQLTAVGGAFNLPPPEMLTAPTRTHPCQIDEEGTMATCYLVRVEDFKAILDYAKAQCLNQGLSEGECRANEPF